MMYIFVKFASIRVPTLSYKNAYRYTDYGEDHNIALLHFYENNTYTATIVTWIYKTECL